jgi:hypothetical protein
MGLDGASAKAPRSRDPSTQPPPRRGRAAYSRVSPSASRRHFDSFAGEGSADGGDDPGGEDPAGEGSEYDSVMRNHIRPALGAVPLTKLQCSAADILERFYGAAELLVLDVDGRYGRAALARLPQLDTT